MAKIPSYCTSRVLNEPALCALKFQVYTFCRFRDERSVEWVCVLILYTIYMNQLNRAHFLFEEINI